MQILIQIGEDLSVERQARVRIRAEEWERVYLHIAEPEKRNRTRFYKRRHPLPEEKGSRIIDPRYPVQLPDEPRKLSLPDHLAQMRRNGIIPSPTAPRRREGACYGLEPTMLAVPISDLTANLLRPCYQQAGCGPHRLFYFQDEPIRAREYWSVAFLQDNSGAGRLEFLRVHFDADRERVLDRSGADLGARGLVWAAAVVPLVTEGSPLSAPDIASYDYDLRHILGSDGDAALQSAYAAWYEAWDPLVREIVRVHQENGGSFASYYHSILALDRSANLHILQREGRLPELAADLAKEGMVYAGILDSGGSCALHDVWMGSHLNHGWYFREPRGSILVFQLKANQRIPKASKDSWLIRREVSNEEHRVGGQA
jgi:hypothetical protein